MLLLLQCSVYALVLVTSYCEDILNRQQIQELKQLDNVRFSASVRHKSKLKGGKSNTTSSRTLPSTRCTTDQPINIDMAFTPETDGENSIIDSGKNDGDRDRSSKPYNGPEKRDNPDHYLDDN